MNKKNYLKSAILAAEKGGETLLSYFEKIETAKNKNKNLRDLVTEVDLLSENEIIKILKKKFKKHNFLAEERGFENNNSNFTWIIDPLDGTVNYIKGIKLCAISIALKYKSEVIIGIVYNPFLKELFYASKDGGAFLNGNKIKVSNSTHLKDSIFISAFSADTNNLKKNKEYINFGTINDKSLGALRIGSAALALAYVAKGSVDGFWGKNLQIWDVEAGICLVNEAKGKIFQNKSGKFKKNILAGNQKLIKIMKKKSLYK